MMKTGGIIRCFLAGMAMALLPAMQASAQAMAPVSAEVSVPRQNVFVNEIFDLTISIDGTGVRLAQDVGLNAIPDGNKLALGEFHELQPERRIVDNQIREFRRSRCQARALAPGVIQIAPILRVKILTRERGFIGYVWIETPLDVPAKPVTLTVSPVPANSRPEGFSGAIGQFAFNVDVTPRDVAVGDLITLSMKIKGDGYLDRVVAPRLSEGRNFKTYDPKPVTEKSSPTEKVFEQILIPQNTNAAAVPEIAFSYFDPQAGSYQTITKGPFPLTFHARGTVAFEQYKPKQTEGTASGSSTGVQSTVAADPPKAEAKGIWHKLVAAFVEEGIAGSMLKNDTAMFAPSESALKSFEVPKGSEVLLLDTHGNWSKIAFGNKRGWIPASSLAQSPAK